MRQHRLKKSILTAEQGIKNLIHGKDTNFTKTC